MTTFKRSQEQKYGDISFALTNKERGRVSPVENVSYPNYYIDMVTNGGACSIGSIWFDEDEECDVKVRYYPNGNTGFSVESIACLHKYLTYLEKNYKKIRNDE